MKGLLFLNGDPPAPQVMQALDYKNFTVCADGAYNYLKNYCVPDVLVGDFDSLDIRFAQAKKIIRLEVEKDFTDGHIALLQLLEAGINDIDIYGAEGGRLDHQLANYSLLALAAKNGARAVIRTAKFDIFFAKGEFTAPAEINKTVSLVPFSDQTHILATRGLKYSINNDVYGRLHIKGISNSAIAQTIGFTIKSGCALVFVEK